MLLLICAGKFGESVLAISSTCAAPVGRGARKTDLDGLQSGRRVEECKKKFRVRSRSSHRALGSSSSPFQAMSAGQSLQFLPLSTSISPSFWHALTSRNLHQLKLSQEPVPIHGHYSKSKQVKDRIKANELVGISGGLELDHDSFSDSSDSEVGSDPNTLSPR